MTRIELARAIDHTLLRADAARVDMEALCDAAIEHGFASVAINPVWTAFCAQRLSGSHVGVDPTIGFPLGATTAHVKVEEAREAVANGATELDMVINIGALKSGYPEFVEQEIASVVQAAQKTPVKVIMEACCLTDAEKVAVCEMCMRAGAAFVKTSTGFGPGGATIEDVRLLRQTVGRKLGVKAAGGIRTYADACAMLEAGADRLGTSAGVQILAEAPA